MTEGDLFGGVISQQNCAQKLSSSPSHNRFQPLADRLRPERLEDVVGQPTLLGPEGRLTRMLEQKSLSSLILWGNPGVGKTTIARLLAQASGLVFVQLSAIFSGVADLKKVFETARNLARTGGQTLLFVDEIHRFNRAQQDGFLPVVEDGTVVLVGATTENPSFSLNAALLSRCQVMVLHRLDDTALEALLTRAEHLIGHTLPLTEEARVTLRAMADGDGRYLLNMVEQILTIKTQTVLDSTLLAHYLARRSVLYDQNRDEHYNLISALHKSMRGSDQDAALYWLARMLKGGEDPRFIARRLVRFATEDIGIADPHALPLTLSAWKAYERLGSPEGELALAQAVVYLSTAPKSNAVYKAYQAVCHFADKTGSLMPPAHILQAPTPLMREVGYGKGYAYDHDTEEGFSGQNYFPDKIPRQVFYQPTNRGYEREVKQRIEAYTRLREHKQQP
ncbi:MAG: replication-associated recombination protein A [Acetobacter sp.]|nr:replication-associated recombination protein A [Acetobacter sp.]